MNQGNVHRKRAKLGLWVTRASWLGCVIIFFAACSASDSNRKTNGVGGIAGSAAAIGGSTAGSSAIAGSGASGSAGADASGASGSAAASAGSGGVAGTADAGSAGVSAGGSGGAAAGAGGGSAGDGSAGTGNASSTSLPKVTSVMGDGPFTVQVDKGVGPNGWVFRPTELGKDGVKHPIFVWGTGATAGPDKYLPYMTQIATHGFVIYVPNTTMVAAADLKAGLDWIIAENDKTDSIYYQKLDTTKVAMGGHSLGSLGTFDVEANETRLTTTIHLAGGSFDGSGSSKVKTPSAYICGQMDLDLASPQCATDYQNATKPTYFVQMSGVDHVHAIDSGVPAIIGWLRWQLAGETERKNMFIGTGCDFCTGIWANAQSKGF